MPDTSNKAKEAAPSGAAPNPMPHHSMRAELVWEGKYDAAGRRVAPLRVPLPFQTVETANESVQERQRGFLFGAGFGEQEWRNRLIWGDKKYVLPSLLTEFAGKVDLIYIDPPFDTGANFSFTATVPQNPIHRMKMPLISRKNRALSNTKPIVTFGVAQKHISALT
jgi:hypothetical protein